MEICAISDKRGVESEYIRLDFWLRSVEFGLIDSRSTKIYLASYEVGPQMGHRKTFLRRLCPQQGAESFDEILCKDFINIQHNLERIGEHPLDANLPVW